MRLLNTLSRFFYGRYGAYGIDATNKALVISALVLSVLNLILQSAAIYIVQTLLFFWFFFRMLSRNISARRNENQKFLNLQAKIKSSFSVSKRRFKERSTHIYKVCPNCKAKLRFPRIKGQHNACCPLCKTNFSVNVK